MGSYRSRFDIIADILRVASGDDGAKKTQIMYGANLSYKVLTRYLSVVLEACLIRFERNRHCYVLTAKGREFLQRYREYSRRNRHVERQLENVNAKKKVLEELCSV
ncbi:MAG: winged helix-turn-helix domain-containing protein [Candidatus Bathycorpusculaceae bacterium]